MLSNIMLTSICSYLNLDFNELKLNNIENSVPQRHSLHSECSTATEASGYQTGQHRYRTVLSSQRFYWAVLT